MVFLEISQLFWTFSKPKFLFNFFYYFLFSISLISILSLVFSWFYLLCLYLAFSYFLSGDLDCWYNTFFFLIEAFSSTKFSAITVTHSLWCFSYLFSFRLMSCLISMKLPLWAIDYYYLAIQNEDATNILPEVVCTCFQLTCVNTKNMLLWSYCMTMFCFVKKLYYLPQWL